MVFKPRLELPWLVDRYELWQHKRFAVPRGLTGWWQINGHSDKPMHLSTDEDLYYVYNYSLWLDLRILLMTPHRRAPRARRFLDALTRAERPWALTSAC